MRAFTVEQAQQYISQEPAAQGLYRCYLALDFEPWRAMLGTLHAQNGDNMSVEALQAIGEEAS